MGAFADLGIAGKLALLTVVGGVAAAGVGAVAVYTEDDLVRRAEHVRVLEQTQGVLNHLDTREAELKVNAYRVVAGDNVEDVVADMPDDLASVTDTLAELDALALPASIRAEIDAVRPDVLGFNDFVAAFVADGARNPDGARARQAEIAERNSVVDDKLEAIHERILAEIATNRAAMADTVQRARWLVLSVIAVGLILITALAVLVSRSVVGPVRRVGRVLDALAEGDFTGRAEVTSRDELGRMAAALDTALGELRTSLQAVYSGAERLASASGRLTATSAEISGAATANDSQIREASATSAEVSRHVNAVAAGAEQMTASIREIARSATDAATVAADAVAQAGAANQKVERLAASSAEIGQVLKLINSIAEQTNLLALNATIEAARAGEAGKGFAVVAGEVKDLAQETAKATEDISRRVTAIQADTTAAADAIQRVGAVVEDINHHQATIAAAVEEQTATTAEITRSVGEAAIGSQRISDNLSGVTDVATATARGVGTTQDAATGLADLSTELKQLVSRFRL